MKTAINLICGVIVLSFLLVCVPRSGAYPTWSVNRDNTNCATCHGDFRSNSYISATDGQNWGNLHNIHRFDMLDGDCSACHNPVFFPVVMDESEGGMGFQPIGCVGCHGRNEDQGQDSDRGAGLRQHHWNTGVMECLGCHADSDPNNYTPVGEDVPPSYYFTPDPNHPTKPTDPCSPGGEEDYAGIGEGLDNDGNDLYDGDDPACSSTIGVCAYTGMLIEGSGQINDFNATCGSDDVYWAANGATFTFVLTDPVSQFELTASFPVGVGGGGINVDIEASKSSNNGILILRQQLFNFSTGTYTGLTGSFVLTTTDVIRNFALPDTADPNDYIDTNGDVRLRIQTTQTAGFPNTKTQLDEVLFNLVSPFGLPGSDGVSEDLFDSVSILLETWGPCEGDCPADLDKSGDVGLEDLLIVLDSRR